MITRREMLRGSLALGGAAMLAPHLAPHLSAAAVTVPEERNITEQLGWQIGPQIYSFSRFPFDEALKMVVACGTATFEQYPGQRVSRDINVGVGPDLLRAENREHLKRVKDLLEESGCSMNAFGVCGAGKADFDFCAEFNIPLLNTEPGFDRIAGVSQLAEEYKIKVGLHNHPHNSIYWYPEIVLAQLRDASPLMGACADTGHWHRSLLDPLACIKRLKGRIVSFHIKDLKGIGVGFNADCVLGQGDVGIEAVLKEFATHDTKDPIPFSIEFEADWDRNQPKVAESVKYFDSVAKSIAAARG